MKLLLASLLLLVLCAAVVFGQTSGDEDDDPRALWLWSGAVTDTSASFRVRTIATASSVRVMLSLDPMFQTGVVGVSNSQATSTASHFIAKLSVAGLQRNSLYYFIAEIDGVRDMTKVGRFRTTVAPKVI